MRFACEQEQKDKISANAYIPYDPTTRGSKYFGFSRKSTLKILVASKVWFTWITILFQRQLYLQTLSLHWSILDISSITPTSQFQIFYALSKCTAKIPKTWVFWSEAVRYILMSAIHTADRKTLWYFNY